MDPLISKTTLIITEGTVAGLAIAAFSRKLGAHLILGVTDTKNLINVARTVFVSPAADATTQTVSARAIRLEEVQGLIRDAGKVDFLVLQGVEMEPGFARIVDKEGSIVLVRQGEAENVQEDLKQWIEEGVGRTINAVVYDSEENGEGIASAVVEFLVNKSASGEVVKV